MFLGEVLDSDLQLDRIVGALCLVCLIEREQLFVIVFEMGIGFLLIMLDGRFVLFPADDLAVVAGVVAERVLFLHYKSIIEILTRQSN